MPCPAMKITVLALLATTSLISSAHTQWRYSAYVQTSAGDYTYTSTARNYYLTQGLQYRQERRSLDASMSLAARDGDNLVVRGEGMMSSNESGLLAMNIGLGDVFVRVNYALVWQRNGWPNVTLRTLTKIHTASASRGLGTGECDAGVFLFPWFERNRARLQLCLWYEYRVVSCVRNLEFRRGPSGDGMA